MTDLQAQAVEPLNDAGVAREVGARVADGAQIVGYLVRHVDGRAETIETGAEPKRAPRRRAPPGPPTVGGLWTVTDHLCRECLGRILLRMDGPEAGSYRCSICGASTSTAVETMCGCGTRLSADSDIGFRCAPNPKRSFKFPHEIAVVRTRLDPVETPIQGALPIRPCK